MKFDRTYTVGAGETRTISTIDSTDIDTDGNQVSGVVVTNNINIYPTDEVQLGIAPYADGNLHVLNDGESVPVKGSFSVMLLNNAMGPVDVRLDGELEIEQVEYYDKLIRSKIPEEIDDGKPLTRTVEGDELFDYLLAKVEEETEELRDNPSPEELGDLFQVLHGLRKSLGIDLEDLCEEVAEKSEENGIFVEDGTGIVLESVRSN